MMQKSEFLKMWDCSGFLQIRSQLLKVIKPQELSWYAYKFYHILASYIGAFIMTS